MMDSISELSSLERIINWVENIDRDDWSLSFANDDMEQTIQHFERVLNSPPKDKEREIEQQFLNFFKWLQNEQRLIIDNQQIERLHKLVTLYADFTGYSSLPYRRLLLNIATNLNKKESDANAN